VTAETLEIQLLGDFQIHVGERVITDDAWKLRKAAGIVKLLALEPTHRLHREQILDALWPDLDPDAAANNFRYALYTARRILDTGGLPLRDGEYLSLGDSESVWVDVHAFEVAADVARRSNDPAAFRAVVDLYRGELLPSDRYEEWLDARRTNLHARFVEVITRLALALEEAGESSSAIDTWQRLIAVDPVQEEAHAHLMLLHARAGRQREALAQFERLTGVLASELGAEPDPVTQQLAEAIAEGRISASPDPAARPDVQSNLPVQPTRIIGRERELTAVRRMLSGSRLVTLTGPGGVGKTRLALAVAAAERGTFDHGVCFIPLAALDRPEQIESALMHAFGLREAAGKSPVETLVEHLRERSILLTLDNFEHIVSAAALVSTLLEACPQLHVLVTSRVPLRLRGEHEYPLHSLTEDASTALFIDRSQHVKPDFRPDNDQMPAIRDICRQLDGLPLAIELAAARSKLLPPQALLRRLEHPLKLLTGGARDLPERQRTLRNTIAWSYDLLDTDDQRMFRRLAVFSGGWTLESAEAIAGMTDDEHAYVLDSLGTLIDNALIQQREQPDGQPRFNMLATIQEFAREQLAGSGEHDMLRDHHLEHFTHFATHAETHLEGEDQALWLDRIEADISNLYAALDWCSQGHRPTLGLELIRALRLYWFMRGHVAEGMRWAASITGLPGVGEYPERYADALNSAGFLARHHGDFTSGHAFINRSLAISQQLGDPKRIGDAQANLGYIVLQEERFEEAEHLYTASLAISRDIDNEQGIADALSHLALVALSRENLHDARKLNEESLAIWQQLGDQEGIAWAHHRLGIVMLMQGDYARAREYFLTNLKISNQLGYIWGLAWAYEGFSQLALIAGSPQLAVRLVSAAATIRDSSGIPLLGGERREVQRVTDVARDQLDETSFATAWQEGRHWTPEEIMFAVRQLTVAAPVN
jgi:predicted ATPase/DNA-binding SARP family transcriptional activator